MTGLTAAAVNAAKGLEDHEVSIGIKYCTKVVLNAARALTFTAALMFNNGKVLLRTKRDALEEARTAARAFITLARDMLKPVLGADFNDNWLAFGFVDSLAIPTKIEDLLSLMQTAAAFLVANPAREVAALNITALQAQALAEALESAFASVTAQEATLEIVKDDRDAKYEAVRGKLVQLVDELTHLIEPLDPRWKAFGFNMPGAQETPDVPTNISAILVGQNAAAMKWDLSARAEYYRVWTKIHGSNADYVAAGSPADLDFTLENLPANSTIDIALSAVNNGGESALSAAVTVVTH